MRVVCVKPLLSAFNHVQIHHGFAFYSVLRITSAPPEDFYPNTPTSFFSQNIGLIKE